MEDSLMETLARLLRGDPVKLKDDQTYQLRDDGLYVEGEKTNLSFFEVADLLPAPELQAARDAHWQTTLEHETGVEELTLDQACKLIKMGQDTIKSATLEIDPDGVEVT